LRDASLTKTTLRALVGAIVVAAFGLVGACGDSEDRPGSVSDPRAALSRDFEAWYDGTFQVTYDVEVDGPSALQDGVVTWFKDGTARQRFDIEGIRRRRYTISRVSWSSFPGIALARHCVWAMARC
jgi:hypothetical protein